MIDKKDIAFCSDTNYLSLLKVAVLSLLRTNENIIIHIIKIDDFDITDIDNMCADFNVEVNFYTYSINLPAKGRYSKAMFGRFFLPDLIKAERILYLDCDIIVSGNLDELFVSYESDSLLSAVEENSVISGYLKNKFNIERYFNSGVLLIKNTLETKQKFKRCIQMIINKKIDVDYPDQDIINIVFNKKITNIPVVFNYFNSSQSKYEKPIIIHYAHEKPWLPLDENYYSYMYFDLVNSVNPYNVNVFKPKIKMTYYISKLIKFGLINIGLFDFFQKIKWSFNAK